MKRYPFDYLYETEIKDLTDLVTKGTINSSERVIMREELLVKNLIRNYTKGLIILEW